ncbi:TatD family hydrolase [Candidatus Saccharibacteria bacterium]|nr:TatD family hydrolase [Candidatus Saccharibacteria bacterium]
MSYLIDSHTHLHDREFFTGEQAEQMLANARNLNVRQVICIGTSHADSLAARDFAATHSDVFWTYGTHPEYAADYLVDCQKSDKLVAIGEVGLDYHYPNYDKAKQWRLLEEMLNLAIELDLPVSFHVRDALPDFFAIFDNFPQLRPSVLHSFSDSKQNLEIALSKGLYIGVNGLATFANLDCYKEATPELLDRIVLETDAPFLTPVPKRGIINESGYVKYVADYLSTKLGVSADLVAEKTTKNVRQIFHLPNPWGTGEH